LYENTLLIKSYSFSLVASVFVALFGGRRSFVDGVLICQGIEAGTTGTILVKQYNNFDVNTAGSPTTLQTITVNGDLGPTQFIKINNVYIPDTLVRSGTLYFETSWSGTPPLTINIGHAAWGLGSGWILPTAIPSGYTANADPGIMNRTYDSGVQSRALVPGPALALGELGKLAEPWSRSNLDFSARSTGVNRRSFGLPSTQIPYVLGFLEFLGTPPIVKSNPGIFVGNEIKQLNWWPIARGRMVDHQQITVNWSNSPPYSDTSIDVDSSWLVLSTGPGWRNLRIWMDVIELVGAITITAASIEYRLDGGSPTSIDIISLNTNGVTGDLLDVTGLIAGTSFNSIIEIRLRITATMTTGGFRSVRMTTTTAASPRCDIAAPWHFPGRGCDDAPPAYKDGTLTDLAPLGGIRHVAAGSSSSSWTVAETTTNETQTRIISFVCPTTGFWRIKAPNNFLAATLGELESRLTAAGAQIGRANKRFHGAMTTSDLTFLNGTWELQAVTPTYATILAAGISVAANLSSGMFFGTIALPAAGTYVVWAKVASQSADGCSLRLLASLTDAFCAEPALIDVRYETVNVAIGSSTSISGATPPATPNRLIKYLVTGTPTGAWAGKAGHLAAWTGFHWLFMAPADIPVPASATIDSVFSLWDGAAWVAASGIRVITALVTVGAAATLHVRAQSCDDEAIAAAPLTPVGTVTIGWEAA